MGWLPIPNSARRLCASVCHVAIIVAIARSEPVAAKPNAVHPACRAVSPRSLWGSAFGSVRFQGLRHARDPSQRVRHDRYAVSSLENLSGRLVRILRVGACAVTRRKYSARIFCAAALRDAPHVRAFTCGVRARQENRSAQMVCRRMRLRLCLLWAGSRAATLSRYLRFQRQRVARAALRPLRRGRSSAAARHASGRRADVGRGTR